VIHFSSKRDQFLIDVHVVVKNSIKAHFVFEYVGKRQIVFDINKDIIKTIVGDMTYKVKDEAHNDNEKLKKILCLTMKLNKPLYLTHSQVPG
jgi:hypothetical protein